MRSLAFREVREAVFLNQFGDAASADTASADLRCEIAFALARRAHVVEDEAEHASFRTPPEMSFTGGIRMPSCQISWHRPIDPG